MPLLKCYSFNMKFSKDNLAKPQICPRCGLKCLEGVETCPDCGLVFSRLEIATNKDAKRKILRHDRDFIIRTSKLPKDVSKKRLVCYSIFFGAFGGHCFYVGRYLRGITLLINFLILFLFVIFNQSLIQINDGALLGVLTTICGLVLLMWPFDVLMILTKKFKVPFAIDLESDSYNDLNSSITLVDEDETNAVSINQNDNKDESKDLDDEDLDRKKKEELNEKNISLLEDIELNKLKDVNKKNRDEKDTKKDTAKEEIGLQSDSENLDVDDLNKDNLNTVLSDEVEKEYEAQHEQSEALDGEAQDNTEENVDNNISEGDDAINYQTLPQEAIEDSVIDELEEFYNNSQLDEEYINNHIEIVYDKDDSDNKEQKDNKDDTK